MANKSKNSNINDISIEFSDLTSEIKWSIADGININWHFIYKQYSYRHKKP